jgi:RimJ/RimL family protein N-acetyltransferase
MKKADPSFVDVRDLHKDDIPHLVQYWFHSPPGFIEGLGVDTRKLASISEFKKTLQEKYDNNKNLSVSRINALTITYKGSPIGSHPINPVVEGDYGIFHAHIWKPELRGMGIGLISYPKACRVFMKRFGLKKILFKTPVQNIGSIRVKEKLGIRCLGEERISFSIMQDNTLTKVFELTAEEAETLGAP